jgi:hypothetical protein
MQQVRKEFGKAQNLLEMIIERESIKEVFIYIYLCIYTYMCISRNICMYVYMNLGRLKILEMIIERESIKEVFIYIYIYIYLFVWIYLKIRACTYVYVCIYEFGKVQNLLEMIGEK